MVNHFIYKNKKQEQISSVLPSFLAVNSTLKLFRVTVADADIGSLKSLNTFLNKYLHQMLVKFEKKCMVRTTRNFYFFNKTHFW